MTAGVFTDEYVIGLDIGTSSCTAVACSLDGHVLRVGRGAYPTVREATGGVRQRPGDWWRASSSALRAAVVPHARCSGISLGGQLGTYVALDERSEPIEDAWTWHDAGPAAVLPRYRETVDQEALAEDLQTRLPLGTNWPLPRLLWMREHRRATFDRTRTLAMPKDYLLHRLTGNLVTDPSSWRGLVRPDGRMHQQVLDALDLPDLVPPRRRSTDVAGELPPLVAAAIGLPAGVPVFLGTGDFACALVGAGVISEGDAFDVGGTSEHVGTLSTQRPVTRDLIVVPYLEALVPGSCVTYGVSSNGGGVTEWLGATLLVDQDASSHGSTLSSLAASSTGRRPLFFIPYLNGERSPVWSPDATGAWLGLRAEHGRGDLVRAAFEGVAYNLRQIRESNPLTTRGGLVRASGGTARSTVWNQIKANVFGAPVAVVAETDATALGAAIHAATGAGAYSSTAAAAAAMTSIGHVVEPEPTAVARYHELYSRYRALSSQLETSRLLDRWTDV